MTLTAAKVVCYCVLHAGCLVFPVIFWCVSIAPNFEVSTRPSMIALFISASFISFSPKFAIACEFNHSLTRFCLSLYAVRSTTTEGIGLAPTAMNNTPKTVRRVCVMETIVEWRRNFCRLEIIYLVLKTLDLDFKTTTICLKTRKRSSGASIPHV